MVSGHDYSVDYQGPHRHYLRPLTWPGVFDAAVERQGDAVAVVDPSGPHSWREWQHASRALAQSLRELGIVPGDVVAVYLPNSWEFLVAHVAIAYLGAVMLPLHMAHRRHEIVALLGRAEAKVLILTSTYHGHPLDEIGRAVKTTVPSLERVIWVGETGSSELTLAQLVDGGWGHPLTNCMVSPDDPFVLAASSGTTSSRPKICMHTHAGLLSNAWQTAVDGRGRPDDILLSASPFSHAFGFLSVHLSVIMQHSQVILADWNARRCLQTLKDRGVTVLFAVPAQVVDLLRAAEEGVPRGLSLREIRTGGAAVPREIVAAVRRRFGADTVVQWGMSEVGSGCYTVPTDDPELASRTVGRPMGGAEVRILDPEGRPVPTGQIGELAYRSPYMFRGYYHDEELTRSYVMDDGWLLTGDLAAMNADGTIAYRGRKTETINRGGLKFSALEVESLLTDLPHIQQMAVVSRPDVRLGERAVLLVALRSGYALTLEDVQEHLRKKELAPYKWPEEIKIMDALPTTPTGKIARGQILAWMAEEPEYDR